VTAYRIAGLLVSLWAGSLVTVCGLAAPTAFAVLERRFAGLLAAQLFFWETIVGVFVVTAVFIAHRFGQFSVSRPVVIALVVGAIAPLTSELVLGPMMQAARNAGDMTRFGALHGISALLFVIACLSAILAAWQFTRPAA
jgi:Domain of unknown function (DUF4149)